jgi:hypothetical protein
MTVTTARAGATRLQQLFASIVGERGRCQERPRHLAPVLRAVTLLAARFACSKSGLQERE